MADDQVDEESTQTGGDTENEAPKKSFGILAARFLQKGKSSPGSITGEFEALTPPDPNQSSDPKVRNLQHIEEEEDIREGSVHGMEVPLSESLYADIGLDDAGGYGDEGELGGDLAYSQSVSDNSYDEPAEAASPEVVYDIDAGEQPVISFGSGISDEHAADIELAGGESGVAEYDESFYAASEATSEQPAQYAEESLEHAAPIYEGQGHTEDEITAHDKQTVAQDEVPQYDEQAIAQDEVAQDEVAQYDEQAIAQDEVPQYEEQAITRDEVAAHDEASQYDEQPTDYSAPPDQAAAFSASELDSIGVKSDSTFDKGVLDSIGTDREDKSVAANDAPAVPEKKGLLGKFAGKKDSASRPIIGGVKKDSPEPAGDKPFDSAALDQIGNKGFDKSELDAIGGKGFDSASLDAIGAKGFDSASLDEIGTKGFDSSTLDAIGTKGFDKNELDSIGEPSAAPATDAKEKASKGGGLLGGKFGQKAKGFGADKPKPGSIIPPSTEPTFDQKETGRFMVNSSDVMAAAAAADNLTAEPSQDFSVPIAETPSDEPQEASEELEAAKEPLSASFFDEAGTVEEPEHIPVIPGDEIGRLITDADNAYRLKQYKAAEPIFANVLERLDKIGDDTDPLLPYCLDKMADNLYQLKKYKESLQYFRRLLVLHTKISSADRDMISTLYKIAQTCESLSLTSEADSMYKRAFRLGQQSLVPGDPLLAKVLEGYGTMLMRSEGAEPPAAASERPDGAGAAAGATAGGAGEVQTTLSAEEIAMLNSLGASSERSSEPSPIILSSASSEQAISKSRSPLKESDERADKARASSPSASTAAGGVWVRLGVFICVIVGIVLVTLNVNTDYTAHHVAHSKDFVKHVYKSADGSSTFAITSEDEAQKDNFGKHFAYDYREWNGTPSDDLEVISGQVNGDNFIYEIPQGIKDGAGYVFYEPKAAELSVVAKMRELGRNAQAFYKSKGKYPEGKDLEALGKSLGYKNPFAGGGESVTANSIAWPPSLDGSQVFIKSRFDTSLENGEPWEGEPAGKPGQISAATTSQKQPDASVLYIHGRDRDGKLISRSDGKVLVLAFKNGIEVTPPATDARNEKPGPVPTPMRLSKKDGSINLLTITFTYVPIALFLILTLYFLAKLNQGTQRASNGFSLPIFGIIWSPVLLLLSGLAKFVPAPYSMYCWVAVAVVFVAGAGYIGFNVMKNKPKKVKA